MPTFDTPGPISAVIDLVVGDARITASDRDDTTVEIRPSDASHQQEYGPRSRPGSSTAPAGCSSRRPGSAASACSAGPGRST